MKKFGFLDSWGVGLLGCCDASLCLQVGYRALLSPTGNTSAQGGNVLSILGLFLEVKMEDKWASPPALRSPCTFKRHQAPPPDEGLSNIGLVWERDRAFCIDSLPITQSLVLAI